MEGNIDFYKHAGFVLASTLHIHYNDESEEDEVPYFLAQELLPGYLPKDFEGTYHTPDSYFAALNDPAAFAAYENTFEPARADGGRKLLKVGQLPQFCQSCGMPLTKEENCGKNADGSPNFDYCLYCFHDGHFTKDCTMEEMIDFCARFVEDYNKHTGRNLSQEAYKEDLRRFFPSLKRWKTPAGATEFTVSTLKQQLIAEINALGIKDLPPINDLCVLQGSFVNPEYHLNGNSLHLLDDGKAYWGPQVQKKGDAGRCYGIACDERYIVVSEYGEGGDVAEIVLVKRR